MCISRPSFAGEYVCVSVAPRSQVSTCVYWGVSMYVCVLGGEYVRVLGGEYVRVLGGEYVSKLGKGYFFIVDLY